MAKKKEAAKPAAQSLPPITTAPNTDELEKGLGPNYRPAYPLVPHAQPFGPTVATSALNAVVSGITGTAGPFSERGLYGGVTTPSSPSRPLTSINERNRQLRTGSKVYGDEDAYMLKGLVTGLVQEEEASGTVRKRGGGGGVGAKEKRDKLRIERGVDTHVFGPDITHYPRPGDPGTNRAISRGEIQGPLAPRKMRPLTGRERFQTATNFSRTNEFFGNIVPNLMTNPVTKSGQTKAPRYPDASAKPGPLETRRMPFANMTTEGQANVVASALAVGLGGVPFPKEPATTTATSQSGTHVLVDPRKSKKK